MKVCWNITSCCNKNCKYCFKFNQRELTLEENKKVLDSLIERGVSHICWSGGEPFLYKDLKELLKISKQKNMINHVITNASLLNQDNLKENIENVDRLIISLDFVNEDENKIYEIGINYYKHISSLLKVIKQIKPSIEIQINTVIFKGSINQLEDLYNELKQYDIECWKLIRFFPVRGKALEEDLSITDDEFIEVVQKYGSRDNQNFKIVIHGQKEMSQRHIIVLSSGKLVYSENCEDIEIEETLI